MPPSPLKEISSFVFPYFNKFLLLKISFLHALRMSAHGFLLNEKRGFFAFLTLMLHYSNRVNAVFAYQESTPEKSSV